MLIFTILKYFFLFLFAYFIFYILKSIVKQKKREAEGVVFTGPFACVSNSISMMSIIKNHPTSNFFDILLMENFGDDQKQLPRKLGIWMFGELMIFHNHVDCFTEIFVTKNKYYSKHPMKNENSKPLLLNNMVTMATDHPMYKKKRKSVSAAFFQNKIMQMTKIVKRTALKLFKEIQDEGDVVEKDIVKLTTKLQNHIITDVLVGAGESFK